MERSQETKEYTDWLGMRVSDLKHQQTETTTEICQIKQYFKIVDNVSRRVLQMDADAKVAAEQMEAIDAKHQTQQDTTRFEFKALKSRVDSTGAQFARAFECIGRLEKDLMQFKVAEQERLLMQGEDLATKIKRVDDKISTIWNKQQVLEEKNAAVDTAMTEVHKAFDGLVVR